ncbi:unnamed protein product [Prunus armeniaca]
MRIGILWLVQKRRRNIGIDRFVAAWTDTCMHLGSMTSNRAESAHAKLKRQPRSSQLNFERSWVQASRVERVSRFCFYKGFECNCVRVRKVRDRWGGCFIM